MADIKDIRITLVVVNPEECHPLIGLYVNHHLTDGGHWDPNDTIKRIDAWLSVLQSSGWGGKYTCMEYNQVNKDVYFMNGLPVWDDELRSAPPNRYAKCVRSFGDTNTIRESAWDIEYNPPLVPFD